VTIEGGSRRATFAFAAPRRSYYTATEPAVIAAEALARGAAPDVGVILPHAQVDPEQLFARLGSLGIEVARS
jgi:saccharopine dehydrogenase-like NADP-dependent oxidoreductase